MKQEMFLTLLILVDINSAAYKNIFTGSTNLDDQEVSEDVLQDVPEFTKETPEKKYSSPKTQDDYDIQYNEREYSQMLFQTDPYTQPTPSHQPTNKYGQPIEGGFEENGFENLFNKVSTGSKSGEGLLARLEGSVNTEAGQGFFNGFEMSDGENKFQSLFNEHSNSNTNGVQGLLGELTGGEENGLNNTEGSEEVNVIQGMFSKFRGSGEEQEQPEEESTSGVKNLLGELFDDNEDLDSLLLEDNQTDDQFVDEFQAEQNRTNVEVPEKSSEEFRGIDINELVGSKRGDVNYLISLHDNKKNYLGATPNCNSCSEKIEPVCGKNNILYRNICRMECQGVELKKLGLC